MRRLAPALLLAFLSACQPTAPSTPRPDSPPFGIHTEDVRRFYRLYDQSQGRPTKEQLQSAYLDEASPGLRQFVQSRIGSADRLAAAILASPEAYRHAETCAAVLPAVREQLDHVLPRLTALYPPASFPPLTIVIGRNNTGGTTTTEGVIIGLETICRADWMNPDVTARLVHLIAHEYVHVQQPAAQVEPPPDASLLFQTLLEGGAEFIGELISGNVAYAHLPDQIRGRECAIEARFMAEFRQTDTSDWLYNGTGTPDEPGDLGYWIGYRIAKSHYTHAKDKRQAIIDILSISNSNAVAFLEASGWQPTAHCADHADGG